MRYPSIELPAEPWILRLALAHRLTPDGETLFDDTVNGRRPAASALPIWHHETDTPVRTTHFPDPVAYEYAMARLVPLVADFHALAAKLCGRVLGDPAAERGAPHGVNVGLIADIEVFAARERPVEVEFWVEAPADEDYENVRLLARFVADARTFPRRAFEEPFRPTCLDGEGRSARETEDDDDWAELRAAADESRRAIRDFLGTLPESDPL